MLVRDGYETMRLFSRTERSCRGCGVKACPHPPPLPFQRGGTGGFEAGGNHCRDELLGDVVPRIHPPGPRNIAFRA